MVWYETVLLVVTALSLVVALAVYVRNMPKIAAIDTKELSDEKQRQLKAIMAEQRLARKLRQRLGALSGVFRPVISLVKTVTTSWQDKIRQVEERYKIERLAVKSVTERGQESLQQKISQLLQKAENHARDDEYAQAEEVYISVIKLDPQSIDAFEGLGEVYRLQKKYTESLEVYQYIQKLLQDSDTASVHIAALHEPENTRDAGTLVKSIKARVLYEMALIHQEMDALDVALQTLQEVIQLEASNPKYLDALLEISIIQKDQKLAEEVFAKLKEVNPDNKKLKEFKEQIAAL